MASVLIVEDDFLQSKNMEELFRSHGYNIAGVAISGEGAVSLAEIRSPDVLVVDVRLMGRLDGIDAAGHIRAKHDCGLIFVTAHHDDNSVARMMALNPDKILPKPSNPLGLLNAVEAALARRRTKPH